VSFIWDAIAGCSLPGMTLVTALLFFLAHLLSDVVTLILAMLNWFLSITILNVGGVHQALADLFGPTPTGAITGLYAGMAALGLSIATAALVWGVLRNQEAMLLGNRWEGARALIGRAGGAVVWIVATPLALYVLVYVNDQLVTLMNHAMATTVWHTGACTLTSATGGAIEGLGTSAIGIALTILFYQVIGLALIAGILAAVGQYFLRLFQIVFWGALLPVAAGTSVADPQRRAWSYVWGQVTGSIFTQAAMALGIFLTETVMLAPDSTAVMAKLLSYTMGAAGFFVVSRIPRYFQELQGHTVGGGSEMAAIAGGYVMGRFGSQALSATAGGQVAGELFAATKERTTQRLNQGPGPLATAYQTFRRHAYVAQGRNAIDDAGAQADAGLVADRVAATGITDQATLDALATMPAARDAATAVRTVPPTVPLPDHPSPGMGGVLPDRGGQRPESPGSGAPVGVRPSVDAGTGVRTAPGGDPPLTADGDPSGGDWRGGASIDDALPDGGGSLPATVRPPTASLPSGTSPNASPSAPRSASGADDGAPPVAEAVSRTPLYGVGSGSAVGREGSAFAAAMAPLAQNYLYSQLFTDSRARAQLGTFGVGVSPATHDAWVAHPDAAPVSARVLHPHVLERVQRLHQLDQDLNAQPQEALARLFGVTPDDLNNPVYQQQIEAALHAVQRRRPGRGAFIQPLVRDAQDNYDIGSPGRS